ncbi:MAG: hypothetical protein ACTSUV_02710 [Candidatus Ranarchaeia archaeon]
MVKILEIDKFEITRKETLIMKIKIKKKMKEEQSQVFLKPHSIKDKGKIVIEINKWVKIVWEKKTNPWNENKPYIAQIPGQIMEF